MKLNCFNWLLSINKCNLTRLHSWINQDNLRQGGSFQKSIPIGWSSLYYLLCLCRAPEAKNLFVCLCFNYLVSLTTGEASWLCVKNYFEKDAKSCTTCLTDCHIQGLKGITTQFLPLQILSGSLVGIFMDKALTSTANI